MKWSVRLLATAMLVATACTADRSSPSDDPPPPGVTIQVVDASGIPVAGVDAGVLLLLNGDEQSFRNPALARTDAEGVARIDVLREDLATKAIVAVAEGGALIGVRRLNEAEIAALSTAEGNQIPVVVALEESASLSLDVVCPELAERGRAPRLTTATLLHDEHDVLVSSQAGSHHEFSAPPGEYAIEVRGEETHWKTIVVKLAAPGLELGEVAVAATRFALLAGEPAPEIAHDGAWLGEPVRLSDLRGRVVLLEFWGAWCSDCIAAMPTLLDFYEEHRDQGLVVVGVHVDGGDGYDTPKAIARPLTQLEVVAWGGRKMSFPSALAVAEETSYGDDVERAARCRLAADFGVAFYPTTILIDRVGKIVRAVDLSVAEDAQLVSDLLSE